MIARWSAEARALEMEERMRYAEYDKSSDDDFVEEEVVVQDNSGVQQQQHSGVQRTATAPPETARLTTKTKTGQQKK